jgi:hypothetical protein
MAFNLTYWLRKTPQPSTVLVDDKPVAVPKNARAWKDLTKTIESLDGTKLVCLDAKGEIIRSTLLEGDEGDKPQPSPEMSDLQLFAKLLAEAYDRGASKMQPIVDSAMAFVERGGQRLAKAEADNERLRAHLHKLNIQIAQLNNQPEPAEESILTTIVAGMAAGHGNPLGIAKTAVKK